MKVQTKLNGTAKFEVTPGQRLRVFQRAVIPGEVIIHDDSQLFIARLKDISAGGVFIEDLTMLPQGAQVRIVVKSPKLDATVQATGTVVRIESNSRRGAAVEFTSISSKSREVIQNCVFETRMETALKVV
jgi:c-di-GMP-binding flagellar brake protein YcgR